MRESHALAHRANEEGRQDLARPPGIDSFISAQKTVLQRNRQGLDHKAKLTMRKAYGFRTFRITEIALMLGWVAQFAPYSSRCGAIDIYPKCGNDARPTLGQRALSPKAAMAAPRPNTARAR